MLRSNMIFRALGLIAVTTTTLLTTGCRSPQSSDTTWTRLFNGRDLTGWTVVCKPADQAKAFWSVEDGCIVANSLHDGEHDYVWLLSDREYTNFVVRLKFQAYRNSPGNTGLQIRSRYDFSAGWLDGPQIDIHPPGPWRTGMVWDETRGNQRWLYPAIPQGTWVEPEMAEPNLQLFFSNDSPDWNELVVTADGTRLHAVLNNLTVMDYEGSGVLDDPNHRQRNVGLYGHLALQIHTGDRLLVRFKDIEIRELP